MAIVIISRERTGPLGFGRKEKVSLAECSVLKIHAYMVNIKSHTLVEKVTGLIVFLLIASLLAACSGPISASGANSTEKGTGSQSQSGNTSGDGSGVSLLSGGTPGQNMPSVEGTPNTSQEIPPRTGDNGGIITSNGDRIDSGGDNSGAPGVSGSSNGGGDSGGYVEWPSLTLKTYVDEKYGFSISYPDFYVVQLGPMAGSQPAVMPKYVVRFQDKKIAEGATADFEPPLFMIEIFSDKGDLTLKDWIIKNQFASQGATFVDVEKPSANESIRVTLPTLMAPNSSIYYSVGQYIYRVTFLSPYSEQMLATLTFAE